MILAASVFVQVVQTPSETPSFVCKPNKLRGADFRRGYGNADTPLAVTWFHLRCTAVMAAHGRPQARAALSLVVGASQYSIACSIQDLVWRLARNEFEQIYSIKAYQVHRAGQSPTDEKARDQYDDDSTGPVRVVGTYYCNCKSRSFEVAERAETPWKLGWGCLRSRS